MKINIEKEFAACVRALDGKVLDDMPGNPLFSKADYWFPTENVFGELKRLSEDLIEKDDFKQKVTKLYDS